MGKEAVFTMKLEAELRDQFMSEAEAVDRPASQLVREFMRDYVQRQREAREHDAWFREGVEAALREADDPNTVFKSHDEVMTKLEKRILARIAAADRNEN